MHPVDFSQRKLQIFGSSFVSYSLQWRGWSHYECVRISTWNNTLDIYLLFENGHKSTQARCKVCSNVAKYTTAIDFRLTSVFFINLEHLSYPTVVLLFILWIGKCWLKVRRQNNTVMLTYSHSHASGILLCQCSCHGNEKQNFESFFNYDANLTSVITMELNFIFFLCDVRFSVTSLAVTSSLLKLAWNFEVLFLNSGYAPGFDVLYNKPMISVLLKIFLTYFEKIQ